MSGLERAAENYPIEMLLLRLRKKLLNAYKEDDTTINSESEKELEDKSKKKKNV